MERIYSSLDKNGDGASAPISSLSEVFYKISARDWLSGWLLAAPLTAVLVGFLVCPILLILVVSFWLATEWSFVPAFVFDNFLYQDKTRTLMRQVPVHEGEELLPR